MNEKPQVPPDWDDESTPETRAAWAEFYSSQAVQEAQARYTAREQELQPLRDFYNNEKTLAHLRFQQETHSEMVRLTAKLQELEHMSADVKDIDGSVHPGV